MSKQMEDFERGEMVMNDSEVRRRELLRQTRKLYNDERIPAVHPRYGNLYRELYQDGSEDVSESGSFVFRLALGILLFVCYVWMDYAEVPVMNVSSDQIATQIEKQMDIEDLQAVWKNL